MSSFLKQGLRKSNESNRRKVKHHTKAFYQIMNKMDDIANQLVKLDIEITEDNIEVEVKKLIDRDIDSMEKFLLLAKVYNYKEYETENNIS